MEDLEGSSAARERFLLRVLARTLGSRAAKSLHFLGPAAGGLLCSPYVDDLTLVEFWPTSHSSYMFSWQAFASAGWDVAEDARKNLECSWRSADPE
eukprot:935352-Amphidinium_carterae.1